MFWVVELYIVKPVKSVLDSINSVNNTDLSKTGGINVLSLNLPFNSNMSPQVVASVIKTFVNSSGHSLQMNYVSKENLINARKEPEKYKDLIVRVYGFSTYFINLTDICRLRFCVTLLFFKTLFKKHWNVSLAVSQVHIRIMHAIKKHRQKAVFLVTV